MTVKPKRDLIAQFLERIEEVRLHLGLSQDVFARRVGSNQSTYGNMVARGSKPSPDLLAGIVTELGIDPTWLLTGEGPMLREGAGERLPATFVRAIDGDTVELSLGGPLPEAVRLLGVDTPEMHHRCASASWQTRLRRKAARARDFVAARLSAARRITIEPHGRGKYGRVLAHVFYDGRDLAADLLAVRLAKPIVAHRARWCTP